MIADTASTSGVKTSGSLMGQKHELQIDDAAMAHIMSVLTDLYSNPTAAIIREYSTNALDAHVEAGVTKPIEVTLPNPLNPFLKIKDHGVGLTEKDIAEIYSRYGASTKRSTNDQVGMLGLGCKSALTYAQQFTLASVKDGRRVQVAISRETTGGSMTVVDDRATDEPNGTEVSIPARKDSVGGYDTLFREARLLFAYWPKGTVLINGKPPEDDVWSIQDSMWLVKDKMLIRPVAVNQRGYKENVQHRVVMGNVPYPLDAEHAPDVKVADGYEVVFFVGIGEVNFVPSREMLNYSDDRTVKRCKALSDEFKAAAAAAVQKRINAAPSKPEAIEAMLSAQKYLREAGSYGSYFYKGDRMPTKFQIPGAKHERDPQYRYNMISNLDQPEYRLLSIPRRSYVQNQCDSVLSAPVTEWPRAFWVYGYEGKKFSAPQKQKLLKYLEQQNLTEDISRIYMMKGNPAAIHGWVRVGRIVDWSVVNAVKLDRNVAAFGSTKNIPGSYDNVVIDGKRHSEVPAKDIDQSKPVYWYGGSWYNTLAYGSILDRRLKGGYTIVPLPSNRKEKFLRNFPKAEEVTVAVRKLYDAWIASLTEDQRLVLHMREQRCRDALRAIDPAKVKDPMLKRSAKIARTDSKALVETRQEFTNVLGALDFKRPTWENPLSKYPLFSTAHMRTTEGSKHTYLYLNAAYKA